ncbi:MAG: hypothetical protein ACREAC_33195, partial [Blastocatellia bacterium]
MTQLKDFRGIEGTDFFESDRGFQTILSDLLPDGSKDRVFADLHECGKLAGGLWNNLAQEASRQENLPKIVKRDRVGNPVEKVDFGPLTRQLRRQVAEFGVFTRPQTELHKFALV